MPWYLVMVDVRWIGAFFALVLVAPFALARFIRNAQGPREDAPKLVTWGEVTSSPVDFGPRTLGASDSQRMAALEADEQCRIALAKGRDGCP